MKERVVRVERRDLKRSQLECKKEWNFGLGIIFCGDRRFG